MDDNDEGRGGNVEEEEPPSSPPPTHHHHRHNPRSFGTTAPTPTSSLASEAYLAVRDFFSASVAEARGDRGSAAAHAAAAASRVQTAVEAEGALARGDFGPVCDLLATAFAWKAQVGFFCLWGTRPLSISQPYGGGKTAAAAPTTTPRAPPLTHPPPAPHPPRKNLPGPQ